MIHLENISFNYRRKQNLFEDLSLDLVQGSIYGLFGLNGAGKTTLLRLISGLSIPTEGKAEVFGVNPGLRQPELLGDLFLISEDLYLPKLSIKNFARTYGPFYPKFDGEQFGELLEIFELSENDHLKKISQGQKKKAIIAFGLATNTRILLMDEPTNALDIPSKKKFRQIIARAINPERLFMISTHQVRDLQSLIDTVIILQEGKILFQQSLVDIMDRLSFEMVYQEPEERDTIYYERAPGGYLTIQPKTRESLLEADIEALFNATITNPTKIKEQFKQESYAD